MQVDFEGQTAFFHYDPAKAKRLLAEAGYPNGFDGGELHQLPPYFALGEAIAGYLQAVGIRLKMRMTERGAFMAFVSSKKAKGLCVCSTAVYGNAASRLSEVIPSDGAWAYGGYPDIDALFKQHSTLWEGEAFLDKPCSVKGLLEAVALILYGRIIPSFAHGSRLPDTFKG